MKNACGNGGKEESAENMYTRVCSRCGMPVETEEDEDLKKEYPYYCPGCNENMYSFETMGRQDKERRNT